MSRHGNPGQRIAVLGGRHEFEVRTLEQSQESFTVRYSITPPLPDDRTPLAQPVYMWLEAVDDLGNRYTDFGGARGISPDGSRTEGSLSAQPAAAAGSRSLTVRLVFMSGADESGYDLTIPLPSKP
ncbi:hypothetical protein [Streptomyces sp. NPDC051567]|uniref:hypothetical protein n=1 Tax=Streptomyces sp. NPDC051567 TaxID=3365660 RepID=UPI0037B8102E